MDSRNILGRHSLQGDMDEWTQSPLAPLSALEGMLDGALPRADAQPARSQAISAEEVALVSRARAGDQDAFAVLVRLHQNQVYNVALRILRDNEEAYEATQEVFLAAWQGLRGFRGQARFATWIYRITYNYCLRVSEGHRRTQQVRAELVAESARESQPATMMSAEHARDAERELRETVRAELASLPAKYRIVLVLRHLQDLSYEEIAQAMRVPIGTVKTQLFRARALLKERLEGLDSAPVRGIAFADRALRSDGAMRAEEKRAGFGGGFLSILDRKRDQPRKGDER